MPFAMRVRPHARLVPSLNWPLPLRLLTIGSVLLTVLLCVVAHARDDTAHSPETPATVSAIAASDIAAPGTPGHPHAHTECVPGLVVRAAHEAQRSAPAAVAPPLVVLSAVAGGPGARSGPVREARGPRTERSGRSTLTAVCRWRV